MKEITDGFALLLGSPSYKTFIVDQITRVFCQFSIHLFTFDTNNNLPNALLSVIPFVYRDGTVMDFHRGSCTIEFIKLVEEKT